MEKVTIWGSFGNSPEARMLDALFPASTFSTKRLKQDLIIDTIKAFYDCDTVIAVGDLYDGTNRAEALKVWFIDDAAAVEAKLKWEGE